MSRPPINAISAVPKRHESKIQELRHERKAEGQRLDGLKKMLQIKLNSDSNRMGPNRVA